MPLPAPYRNPWRNLADDLRAVVADLRLRLQELWRCNRQGLLWRPTWWPADLAPVFWPLLLVLVLALVGGAASAAVLALRPGAAPPQEPPALVASDDEPMEQPEPLEVPRTPPPPPPDLPPEPPPEELPAPESVEAEPQPEDPLADLLQRSEADGLLQAAEVLTDQLTLVLELSPRFQALAAPEQQRRATQWLEWAQELGYDHLELRDPAAVLLGRDALVGGGMIVLTSSSGS